MNAREKLIRDYWKRNNHLWPNGLPAFRVEVRDPIKPKLWPGSPDTWTIPDIEVLEFRIERITRGDAPYQTVYDRVVCEGVVLVELARGP